MGIASLQSKKERQKEQKDILTHECSDRRKRIELKIYGWSRHNNK